MKTFLLALFLLACGCPVLAAVPVDQLPAPAGYRWADVSEAGSSSASLELRTEQGTPTSIFFTFAMPGARLLESESADWSRGVQVPFPGRTLWYAHPESNLSAEERFLSLLPSVGYPKPQLARFVSRTPAGLTFATFQDDLAAYRAGASPVSLQSVLDGVNEQVSATRADILSKLSQGTLVESDSSSWRTDLANLMAGVFDVFEPIKGREIDGHEGYYGFAAFPLATFQSYGAQAFAEAFHDLDRNGGCPLEWVKSATHIELPVRLSLLSLLTHNHLSEENFLRGAIAQVGLEYGWFFALSLNKLYAQDARCRENSTREARPEFAALYPAQPGSPYDRHNGEAIMVENEGQTYAVPYKKFYHLYGAVVLGSRLANLRAIHYGPFFYKQSLVSDLVKQGGLAYKRLSAGEDSPELSVMESIYGLGGRIGYCLE